MSEVIQYELWRECNCKCTYCTLGKDNIFTSEKLKLKSLQTAIDEIKQFKKGEHKIIGFIGGEFFQGQLNTDKIKNKFFELFDVVNDILNKEIVETLWINASLLIGDQKDLYYILDKIDKKDKVWVLTSYDTMGRFHSQKMLDTWEYHLNKIHDTYPMMGLNITSILTGDFIKKFLKDEIDIFKYSKMVGATIYFKNPVQPIYNKHLTNLEFNEILGDFFPKRKEVLMFFNKYFDMFGEKEYDKLISTDLRADEIRKNYNNSTDRNIKFIRNRETLVEYEEGSDEELLPCGHNDIYCSYSDSNACILCDKHRIKISKGCI